jgi:protoporphyrinogen oxidase
LIDAADDVWHLSDAEILAKVYHDLARFFPRCRGQVPFDSTVLRLKNTYCGTRVGYWSKIPRQHQTGLTGIWLAGDYTDGVYHYGMESAIISGKAVVNEILRAIQHPGFEILRPRYLPFVRA